MFWEVRVAKPFIWNFFEFGSNFLNGFVFANGHWKNFLLNLFGSAVFIGGQVVFGAINIGGVIDFFWVAIFTRVVYVATVNASGLWFAEEFRVAMSVVIGTESNIRNVNFYEVAFFVQEGMLWEDLTFKGN